MQGFKTNVEALSEPDDALKSRAKGLLQQSTDVLAAAGIQAQACSRPYCIIEPLQKGQLDS
ncbi:MAG: hypothetical protein FKY71_02445 [Spiribacter salinus]|uniref:Uncharacterized protein n=1 Tax=Spiribacter salinus TaxID=1335746 RepID=A0A540VWX4_9GAMM|nr:MAG: hypothetical protein FKY71_02445 [Spiribacter salinus]